jgi:hypothetical protein
MDKPSASPHNRHSKCDMIVMLYHLFISHGEEIKALTETQPLLM